MKCIQPIQLIHPQSGYPIEVRCGQCLQCRIRKQKVWAFRCQLEYLQHSESVFLTLTYSEETCPENLDYRDFWTFCRRLRRRPGAEKMRFFCCGEYGTKSGRPHWHALIFNATFPEKGLCRIEQWPQGFAYIGQVTPASINYTARYVLKGGPRGDEALFGSSRKPGIGVDGLLQIGQRLAEHGMPFDKGTPSLASGKTYYPLDNYCREKIAEGVRKAGGLVSHDYSPMQSGLRAATALRLEQLGGDPVLRAKQSERSFLQWSERQRMELSREKI